MLLLADQRMVGVAARSGCPALFMSAHCPQRDVAMRETGTATNFAQASGERRDLPPEFLIRDEGSFGWGVFHQRHPALIRQLSASLPYSPEQCAALDALVQESRFGVVQEPAAEGLGRQSWLTWGQPYFGHPWRDAPFLWAESYFYRRLLEAVDFFAPGPWQGVDPFAPLKAAELRDPELERDFAWLDNLNDAGRRESFDALLLAALHGNRADLGFRFGSSAGQLQEGRPEQLMSDDSAKVWSYLNENAPLSVIIVLDNAGRELLADLLLADYLITANLASTIVLHSKPTPYYVSDAVTADVRDCLIRLAAMPGAAGQAGHRLQRVPAEGRLRIDTHAFYCAPLSFHDMPKDLAQTLAGAGLTIFKGDLNYRRLVGDREWDPTLPFASATAYLPSPAVALRTLKSDVIVGLDRDTVTHLDAVDPAWRTNGTQALVQAAL